MIPREEKQLLIADWNKTVNFFSFIIAFSFSLEPWQCFSSVLHPLIQPEPFSSFQFSLCSPLLPREAVNQAVNQAGHQAGHMAGHMAGSEAVSKSGSRSKAVSMAISEVGSSAVNEAAQ